MAVTAAPDYYVISYDAGEDLPYGFAWFADIGLGPHAPAFTYHKTRAECVERAGLHTRRTNPVLLEDDAA